MTQIEGKFYPLKHEEWLQACQELTPAELKVLYYIRTCDPYSNGVQLTAAGISRDLKCERQTVSRAIKRLDVLGYIEMEPLAFNVRLKGKGLLSTIDGPDGVTTHQGCDETPPVITTHQEGSLHTEDDHHTPDAITTHQAEPETLTQQDFQEPKTLNTPKTFKTPLERRQEVLNVWAEYEDRLKIYGVYSQMWVGQDLIDRDDYQECVKASYRHSPEEVRRRLISFCTRVKDMRADQIGDVYKYLKSYLTSS